MPNETSASTKTKVVTDLCATAELKAQETYLRLRTLHIEAHSGAPNAVNFALLMADQSVDALRFWLDELQKAVSELPTAPREVGE